MITHIVLAKPAEGRSDDDFRELEATLAALERLPGVQRFTSGPDFSGRSKGYAYAAVMYFDNRTALQTYLSSPEHLRLVDVLNGLAPERLVIDYETETNGISTPGGSAHSPS